MKIFSAAQIRQWDEFTIQHEPVSSLDLMERAASRCAEWLLLHFNSDEEFLVFCGKGNNGGDGLAIARHLFDENRKVSVFVLMSQSGPTADFTANLDRLKENKIDIRYISVPADIPQVLPSHIIVDALFGSGLNRPLDGLAITLVQKLNSSGSTIVSIDIPSGMFVDKSSAGLSVIHAVYTLSFQVYKLAFLLPENGELSGEVIILDVGLHQDFEEKENSGFYLLEKRDLRTIIQPRKKFSHKGSYGHAVVFAGSYGMMGAAILAVKACLHSGVGKTTAAIPACGINIMQSAIPEAICKADPEENYLKNIIHLDPFDAAGIGPGIGTRPDTVHWLNEIISATEYPIILDADALNILSENKELLRKIPATSIITPHPKEFERLFGYSGNDFDRLNLALVNARELGIFIILKGYHTLIACPDGRAFFNSTGNPGMATAGSGDVLTGLLTGLLAQGYSPENTCKAGVFLHGLAGDLAAAELSEPALIAGDISNYVGKAYLDLNL